MIRDHGRPRRQEIGDATRSARKWTPRRTPAFEPLEGRRLLSHASRAFPTQFIHTRDGTAYTISVSGPGVVSARPSGHGQVTINLSGTTSDSQVSLVQTLFRSRAVASHLQIARINVQSGVLGSFQARDTADLLGPISPLHGPVSTLQFDALAPAAQIDVDGSLGQLSVAHDAILGPGGHIHVAGPISVGGNLADGGQINAGSLNVGQNLALNPSATLNVAGALAVGGSFTDDGQARASSLDVGQNLTLNASRILKVAGTLSVGGDTTLNGGQVELGGAGGLKVGGNLGVTSGGKIHVGGDVTGPISIGNGLNLDGGQIVIDRDLIGAVSVGGNLTALHGGGLLVGRDIIGRIAINGDAVLSAGGSIVAGRNLTSIKVVGNLDTSMGGQIKTGGNLDLLSVQGFLQGHGANDIAVGLNLGNLQVLGGGANLGGVRELDLNAGKNIEGLDIPHGIFNSLITAGVLIDGGKPTTTVGANIGPDGPDAVFDSTITAGVQIRNLTIGGDVISDRPTNPNGRPTRIVAGEDRQGNFISGGNIDNFQITGRLVDAVLAASVQPFGGDGTVMSPCGKAPGDGGHNTYDAPAGTIRIGTTDASVSRFNFTAPPYNHVIDPTIDDCVLPGSINRSFAPTPLPPLVASTPGIKIPLPSKSTVLGGVVSTAHGDEADYAGIFAADTSGVFVGILPK